MHNKEQQMRVPVTTQLLLPAGQEIIRIVDSAIGVVQTVRGNWQLFAQGKISAAEMKETLPRILEWRKRNVVILDQYPDIVRSRMRV